MFGPTAGYGSTALETDRIAGTFAQLVLLRARAIVNQKKHDARRTSDCVLFLKYFVSARLVRKIRRRHSRVTGKPLAFLLATATVVVWAITGPIFKYSDTWQLVINTGTTIVTFLMVFLIQHTQNRDTLARCK